jgi:hypothetical protein
LWYRIEELGFRVDCLGHPKVIGSSDYGIEYPGFGKYFLTPRLKEYGLIIQGLRILNVRRSFPGFLILDSDRVYSLLRRRGLSRM